MPWNLKTLLRCVLANFWQILALLAATTVAPCCKTQPCFVAAIFCGSQLHLGASSVVFRVRYPKIVSAGARRLRLNTLFIDQSCRSLDGYIGVHHPPLLLSPNDKRLLRWWLHGAYTFAAPSLQEVRGYTQYNVEGKMLVWALVEDSGLAMHRPYSLYFQTWVWSRVSVGRRIIPHCGFNSSHEFSIQIARACFGLTSPVLQLKICSLVSCSFRYMFVYLSLSISLISLTKMFPYYGNFLHTFYGYWDFILDALLYDELLMDAFHNIVRFWQTNLVEK